MHGDARRPLRRGQQRGIDSEAVAPLIFPNPFKLDNTRNRMLPASLFRAYSASSGDDRTLLCYEPTLLSTKRGCSARASNWGPAGGPGASPMQSSLKTGTRAPSHGHSDRLPAPAPIPESGTWPVPDSGNSGVRH